MAKPLCVGCRKPVGRNWKTLVFGGETEEGVFEVLETWEPLHPRCVEELRHALSHVAQDQEVEIDHFEVSEDGQARHIQESGGR